MYGHVFYKSTSEKQAEFLNSELQSGKVQFSRRIGRQYVYPY